MTVDQQVVEALERLERRIALIEERLGIVPEQSGTSDDRHSESEHDDAVAVNGGDTREEELEYELGQSWFAKVGIVALALGIAFLLTLPFEDYPQFLVPVFGYALGGGLFFLSRLWKESLTLLSNYMRGAAVALLYFSGLRLTYFSASPALSPDALTSFIPLIASAILAFVLALRRRSVYLTLLATILAYGTLWAVPSMAVITLGSVLLSVYASYLYVQRGWLRVFYAAILLSAASLLHWAVGQPLLTGVFSIVTSPAWSTVLPLLTAAIFAAGMLKRRDRDEGYDIAAGAVLNGGAAYSLVLLLTTLAFGEDFVLWHVFSSLLFLGIAVAFWTIERSKYSTFLYAMLGYQALTIALLKTFDVPEVFVWLSVQSLVVVGTAVWFRSRFIVVVNFFIYIVIFLGYLLVAEQESGFSFGFGLVALISARILNWQQKHLELKTDVMRNAYLISAFIVIPYSLYHFIPRDYVALSWVGVALLYYGLSAVLRLQKYRWMGHATLMLTALYVLIIGIVQLDTMFRVISFLVLGIVLLGTSIFFTRRKAGRGRVEGSEPGKGEKEKE